MTQPAVVVTPLKPNAPLETATDLHVLLRIVPPAADPATAAKPRPRLNLSLAVDSSSSMRGRPVAEAKECAKRVVRALAEGDRISVTQYDTTVTTVVRSVVVGADRSAILAAIDGIHVRGMTNLHGGWLAAAEQAAVGLAPDVLTRVLLLSDGQANQGVTDPAEIAKQAAALAAKGIATTTIGLGENFNEDLMSALAQSGQGQASYGETADDLWPSFEAEFGLLSATCGKKVRLKLSSAAGTVTVDNGFLRDPDGSYILPNLAHGAEISVLAKVAAKGLTGASVSLIEAVLTHDGMDGVAAAPLTASATVPLVPFADFVIGAADPVVAEKVKEAEAADIQLRAKNAARVGDRQTVVALSASLADMAGDNALIGGMAARMSELAAQGDMQMFSKEATYASSSLLRSYAPSADAGAAAMAFTAKRTRQGKAG